MERVITASSIVFSAVSFLLCWLFVDSLTLRFEPKTFLKALGFALLGLASLLSFLPPVTGLSLDSLSWWLSVLAFYLIFAAVLFEPYSKFQLSTILAILALFLVQGHLFLLLQTSLIALAVFQLTYSTKHQDFLSFGLGFLLLSIAELFYALGGSFTASGAVLSLLSSGFLFFWWWQYLVVRFRLKWFRRLETGHDL